MTELKQKENNQEQSVQMVKGPKQFYKQGDMFISYSSPSSELIYDAIPAGTYKLKYSQKVGIFLEKSDDFDIPKDLYGDVADNLQRVKLSFDNRNQNLGVLLHGNSGAGKSMFAKLLSDSFRKDGLPVIIISQDSVALIPEFLDNVSQSCLFFLDEFEKMIENPNDQSFLLPILDGVYTTKHIFLLTVNNSSKINEYMLNRPGRILYSWEYNGLSDQILEDFVNKNVTDHKRAKEIIQILRASRNLSFDIMKAFVAECNLFQHKTPYELVSGFNMEYSNFDFSYRFSKCLVKINGKDMFKDLLPKLNDAEPEFHSVPDFGYQDMMNIPEFYLGNVYYDHDNDEDDQSFELGYFEIEDFSYSKNKFVCVCRIIDEKDFFKELRNQFSEEQLSPLLKSLEKSKNVFELVFYNEEKKKTRIGSKFGH